jgi:hypothetical protein
MSYLMAARHTAAAAVICGVMTSVVVVMVRKALPTLDAIATVSPSCSAFVKALPMAECSASTAVTKSLIRSIALPHSTGAETTITGAGAGARTETVTAGPGTETVTTGPGTGTDTVTGERGTEIVAVGAGAATLVAAMRPVEVPAAKKTAAMAGSMKRFLLNQGRGRGAITYVSISAGACIDLVMDFPLVVMSRNLDPDRPNPQPIRPCDDAWSPGRMPRSYDRCRVSLVEGCRLAS